MRYSIPIWKTAPFCRILLPSIVGIICQFYLPLHVNVIAFCFSISTVLLVIFCLLPIATRFKWRFLQGLLLNSVLIFFAMFLAWQKDMRNDKNWYGHYLADSTSFIVKISAPLVEKPKSYKANAEILYIVDSPVNRSVRGNLVLYFSKDTTLINLQYGTMLLIRKTLQPIRNAGNPGSFDYRQYAAFQQQFHTAYLQPGEWLKLPTRQTNIFTQFIFTTRDKIVQSLRKYFGGAKDELGIAEALLIGYKEDLDKDLVQAYSNAGVVHIIAISGLHLGLIYVVLEWILNRLPLFKNSKLVKTIVLISCLWLFSLLTGASASVLRSAVMFTFILIGKNYFTQSSIYNSLAVSAFILLCYDPYYLWDVGFQLSYFALIGIVMLQQPLYRLVYFKNKLVSKVWNMGSVTLAAQVSTFPVCLYYFHQFPNLFLITNLVAVPLSTLILFAEILLLAVSWIPHISGLLGQLTIWMIWLMNKFIVFINGLSFAVWEDIFANVLTTCTLYLLLIFLCGWWLYRNKIFFHLAVFSLLIYTGQFAYYRLQVNKQAMIVVYNVPKFHAIDFIYRNNFFFAGDSLLEEDRLLQNFHLKPGRTLFQVKPGRLPNLYQHKNVWLFLNKVIMVLDSSVSYRTAENKMPVDLLIINSNPSLKIASVISAIQPKVIVFNSTNSLWKIAGWKKECLALALPCFSIPERGAFVLHIDE